MNPFTWPGPSFIVFYIIVALIAGAACFVRTRFAGGRTVPLTDLTADPYRIAFLRAGAAETARVAIFNLLDRGILSYDGTAVTVARPESAQMLRRSVERVIVAQVGSGRNIEGLMQDSRIAAACAEYERDLQARQLLPDEEEKRFRRRLAWSAVGLIAGVALVKVVYAMSQGRSNVGFLLVLMVAASLWMVWACRSRYTGSGGRALGSLKSLMARLKGNTARVKAGGETNEALLVAAVFGLAALPSQAFPIIDTVFPRLREKSSSSGSSCGASCGSTSSSSSCSSGGGSCGGGGGCGGCGSD
jgi:uncharacterized protein (TIGR04222 family)